MSQLQAIFIEEAAELLPELEEAFLELEENPGDMDVVARIFRAMHTVKGSGGMCDFPNTSNFTHELETVFDQVRKGQVKVTKSLVQIGLDSHSYICQLVESADHLSPTLREQGKEILERLSVFNPNTITDLSADDGVVVATDDTEKSASGLVCYRINFIPEAPLLTYGFNPLSLIRQLTELGEVRSVAYTHEIPDLACMDETACYMSWHVFVSTRESRENIDEIFSLVEEDSKVTIDIIDQEHEVDDDYKRLGDILVDRGDLTEEQLDGFFQQRNLLGEMIAKSGIVTQEKIDSALVEQRIVRDERQQRKQMVTNDSVRVSAARLDTQMDLVGELVIALASLSEIAKKKGDSKLTNVTEEIDQLVTDIRDNVLGTRMLPIGSTFSKFRRLVRDLSSEQGKQIDLVTHGADTELDKTVIDQLGDALVHLIRNSLDHGIELPADRIANGKCETGEITLSAKQAQGHVIIEIKDDGKGIDVNTVWAKAVEKGLATADDRPKDKEILQYIFAAGFSTAEKVTNISGRGVGMDVVKRAIEGLRGTIIMDSVINEGTTITLQLPLTLAIIEGLLVRVGSEVLVIPLSLIKECVETKKTTLNSSRRGLLIRVRDTLIPCLPLQNWVGSQGEMPDDIQVVIVNVEGEKYGLIVDDVIGQQQIVIKSLGSVYKGIKGVSGATILGNGSVALIVDLQQVVQLYEVPDLA